ncbi:MAG: tetratricopeptide repeat protein [Gemmatimonadota bacterium]
MARDVEDMGENFAGAIAASDVVHGPGHWSAAELLVERTRGLRRLGLLPHAESIFRGTLQLAEQTLGESHPFVARALLELAQLLQDTDRGAEAEPYRERARSIIAAQSRELRVQYGFADEAKAGAQAS